MRELVAEEGVTAMESVRVRMARRVNAVRRVVRKDVMAVSSSVHDCVNEYEERARG